MVASLGLSLVSLSLALGPLGQGFHRTSKANGFLRALDQQDRPWFFWVERARFLFVHYLFFLTLLCLLPVARLTDLTD